MNQPTPAESVLILLVEDEPMVLELARDTLETGGYAVVAVKIGDEGVAIIDERVYEFSALVTDVRLGAGPDGWDVARYARERKPDIPVVYATGDSGH